MALETVKSSTLMSRFFKHKVQLYLTVFAEVYLQAICLAPQKTKIMALITVPLTAEITFRICQFSLRAQGQLNSDTCRHVYLHLSETVYSYSLFVPFILLFRVRK